MNHVILCTNNLTKAFGKNEILHGIQFTMHQGEVYGLCGNNGAGKTTFIRLICGLMKPSSGSISIRSEKKYIGYMPQSCRFNDNFTVKETIRFFTSLRQCYIEDSLILCDTLSLDPMKKVRHLSPGQQKKLQLILAMAGDPDLYILDEPTAGLDPRASYEMKLLIDRLHQAGRSILISSHILQDMDDICTNLAVMEAGNLTLNKEIDSSTNLTQLVKDQLHLERKCSNE